MNCSSRDYYTCCSLDTHTNYGSKDLQLGEKAMMIVTHYYGAKQLHKGDYESVCMRHNIHNASHPQGSP